MELFAFVFPFCMAIAGAIVLAATGELDRIRWSRRRRRPAPRKLVGRDSNGRFIKLD